MATPFKDLLSRRSFSESHSLRKRSKPRVQTKLRKEMYQWLLGPGAVFQYPLPGSTNYISAYDSSGRLLRAPKEGRKKDNVPQTDQRSNQHGELDGQSEDLNGEQDLSRGMNARDNRSSPQEKSLPPETVEDLRPFPLNRDFRSEAVLSEELRNEVFRRVTEEGKSVRVVSAELNITMERVAAVVRLKTIEQNWVEQGRKLAAPYQRAVLSMLPKTPFVPGRQPAYHESINDLPVHQDTLVQIFLPVSESREFTRADAAAAFSPTLLPADARIPHPELVLRRRDELAGIREKEVEERHQERMRQEIEDNERRKKEQGDREARQTQVVKGRRWDFRFKEVNVDNAGEDGRGRSGVGWRYGFPHEDRKRAQIKIPTSVS